MTELRADTYLPQETEVLTTWWSHNGRAPVRNVSHTGESGCWSRGSKASGFYRKGSGAGGGIGAVSHDWSI